MNELILHRANITSRSVSDNNTTGTFYDKNKYSKSCHNSRVSFHENSYVTNIEIALAESISIISTNVPLNTEAVQIQDVCSSAAMITLLQKKC